MINIIITCGLIISTIKLVLNITGWKQKAINWQIWLLWQLIHERAFSTFSAVHIGFDFNNNSDSLTRDYPWEFSSRPRAAVCLSPTCSVQISFQTPDDLSVARQITADFKSRYQVKVTHAEIKPRFASIRPNRATSIILPVNRFTKERKRNRSHKTNVSITFTVTNLVTQLTENATRKW